MAGLHWITLVALAAVCASVSGAPMTASEMIEYRERARSMFQHAYDSYMEHGFPYDEVKPRSCKGFNTWGNFSLTLVDSLDTLIVMGNASEFENAYWKVLKALNFDVDFVTSVFESNIRVLGGLLSAHLLLHKTTVTLDSGWPCTGRLLDLAVDLADRLLPAFDTATGMPYGSINLRHGVPDGETTVTCAAGVGTFVIEFGVLSRLTGDMRYESAALKAMQALHDAREATNLVQSHIDVSTGKFTVRESSIGSGMDSYFEYMLKGGVLLHNRNLLDMFNVHYAAIRQYLRRGDWYIIADAVSGNGIMGVYQSLESFFPGLQTLAGDTQAAARTAFQYYMTVWRRFGAVPEMFDLGANTVRSSHPQYPLRPELIESIMYLYQATGDPFWLDAGRDILESIDKITKCPCGYGTILNVSSHNLEDRMHSYFLSETVKYLYLLFDEHNFIFNDLDQGDGSGSGGGNDDRIPAWTRLTPGCQVGVGGYVFSTEAHPFNVGTIGCCHAPHAQHQNDNNITSSSSSSSSSSEHDNSDGRRTTASAPSNAEQNSHRTGEAITSGQYTTRPWPYGAASLSVDSYVIKPANYSSSSSISSIRHGEHASDLASPSSSSKPAIIKTMVARNLEELTKMYSSLVMDMPADVPQHVMDSLQANNVMSSQIPVVTGGSVSDMLASLLDQSPPQSAAGTDVTGQVKFSRLTVADVVQQLPGDWQNALNELLADPVVASGLGGQFPVQSEQSLLRLTEHDLEQVHARLASEASQAERHDDVTRAAQSFLHRFAVDADEADNTYMDDLVDALSEDDIISEVNDAISDAENAARGYKSSLSKSSRRYLEAKSRFQKDIFLSHQYSVPPPGLRSRLEVFGSTVDLHE